MSQSPLTVSGTPKLPLNAKQLERLLILFPKIKAVNLQYIDPNEIFHVLVTHQVVLDSRCLISLINFVFGAEYNFSHGTHESRMGLGYYHSRDGKGGCMVPYD